MLKLTNLTIHRGNLCVADNINLEFNKGKVYAILGPNGAGKSSLLWAIFGIIKSKGLVTFDNVELKPYNNQAWKKRIGYMPQDSIIDANLSALEVVLLGLVDYLGMVVSDEHITLAARLMEQLGIIHLAQRDILSLSGGQRQMVMFAQVLLKNPQVLLLDEPVSALDMYHQCILLRHVKEYTNMKQLVTILVLHDLSLAAQFADELIMLCDSKVQAQGNAHSVLTQELIEKLYRVHTNIFYDDFGLPVVIAKSAVY